jgi:hypothetical protein
MSRLNDLKWTVNNLIHLLLGDEKRMSPADFYYFIGCEVEQLIDELVNKDKVDIDNFNVEICFSYITTCLDTYIFVPNWTLHSNTIRNGEMKRVGKEYAKQLVKKAYEEYKEKKQ